MQEQKLKNIINQIAKIYNRAGEALATLLPEKKEQKFRQWKPIHLCSWLAQRELRIPKFLFGTAWDVSTASYQKSHDISSQLDNPTGISFKDDGLKIYIAGLGNNTVYQYTLSTPWDVSTASYDKSYTLSEESTPYGLFIKRDGSKMYVIGTSNSTVYQYTLSTPWDVSTASYDSSHDINSEAGTPAGVFLLDDGSKMYVLGRVSNTVYQYTLSTPWDVSTASYDNKSYDVSSESGYSYSLFVKPDDSKMYIAGLGNGTVYQYTLSTPGDVSTASYDNKSYDVSSEEGNMMGLFFKGDGSKFFITGWGSVSVHQYGLAVNSPPDVPTNPLPADGATEVPTSPTLSVDVSDQDGDSMDVTFYNNSDDSVIGTKTGVSSGGTASVVWGKADSYDTSYSWYAIADDGSATTQGSTWSFTTETAGLKSPLSFGHGF